MKTEAVIHSSCCSSVVLLDTIQPRQVMDSYKNFSLLFLLCFIFNDSCDSHLIRTVNH